MPPSRRSKHSAAQARRDEKARALGYQSYYDYRLHDYGRQPPGPLELTPDERAQRRGHVEEASSYRDFLAYLRPGDEVMLADHIRYVQKSGTRYGPLEFQVIPEDPERPTVRLTIPHLTRAAIRDLVGELEDEGAVLTPVPSLDVRRLY